MATSTPKRVLLLAVDDSDVRGGLMPAFLDGWCRLGARAG